jgi:hypothetical protein
MCPHQWEHLSRPFTFCLTFTQQWKAWFHHSWVSTQLWVNISVLSVLYSRMSNYSWKLSFSWMTWNGFQFHQSIVCGMKKLAAKCNIGPTSPEPFKTNSWSVSIVKRWQRDNIFQQLCQSKFARHWKLFNGIMGHIWVMWNEHHHSRCGL